MYFHTSLRRILVISLIVSVSSANGGPIHDAAREGDLAEVARLIDVGARVDTEDDSGWTPLMFAANEGRLGIAEFLIGRGADVNASSHPLADLYTPLQVLRADGRLAEALTVKTGGSALDVAIFSGHIGIVELLIAEGADIHGKRSGPTALHSAVVAGDTVLVELLIDSGAEVDSPRRRIRKSTGVPTPLLVAASTGQTEIAELLINEGADVDTIDENEVSPLHWAAYRGNAAMTELLIHSGAEINARNNLGSTPLWEASDGGHLAVAQLLVDSGADVNQGSAFGVTPLHKAALAGHSEVVQLLIDHGADLDAKDVMGRTPREILADLSR